MISYVALERIVEMKAASDTKYRKQLGARPFRSGAKLLTDGELLDKLGSFGLHLDRSALERLLKQALSAEEIANSLVAEPAFKGKQGRWDSDWVWICVAALWQRWFPDAPSFERLDDRMQEGYQQIESRNAPAACRVWLEAWADVLTILDKASMTSMREFDDSFRGTQSLFNWIQDLESELWNAGLRDRQFLTARIAVGEEFLERFAADHDLITENWRRAIAESYFELGEMRKTDSLYGEWLNADPQWGWGWIGWSDCYRHTRTEFRDLKTSEEILRKGLAAADVRDRGDIAERLAHLCEDQGRGEEAAQLREDGRQSNAQVRQTWDIRAGGSVLRQKTTVSFEGEGLPLDQLSSLKDLHHPITPQPALGRLKVGRNDPCLCGSGKKFKKCCGG